jgi:hypothetical protein
MYPNAMKRAKSPRRNDLRYRAEVVINAKATSSPPITAAIHRVNAGCTANKDLAQITDAVPKITTIARATLKEASERATVRLAKSTPNPVRKIAIASINTAAEAAPARSANKAISSDTTPQTTHTQRGLERTLNPCG